MNRYGAQQLEKEVVAITHATGDEGWAIFWSGDGWAIQKDDEAGVFEYDEDAWLFVVRAAVSNRTGWHHRALDFIRTNEPEEFLEIIKHAKKEGVAFGWLESFAAEPSRYQYEPYIPHGSGDAEYRIVDAHSDNRDTMVAVDPDSILTFDKQCELARIIAQAMNASNFEPSYDDVEDA